MDKHYPSPPNSRCTTIASTPDLSLNSTSSDSASEGAWAPAQRNPEGLFECDISGCEKSFTRKGDLRRHLLTRHSKTRPMWQCGCCALQDKVYPTHRRDHLFQHFNKSHSSPDYKSDVVPVDGVYYMFARDGCKEQFERLQAGGDVASGHRPCEDESNKSHPSLMKRSVSSSSSSAGSVNSPKRIKTFPPTGEGFGTSMEPHLEDRALVRDDTSMAMIRWSPSSTITGTGSDSLQNPLDIPSFLATPKNLTAEPGRINSLPNLPVNPMLSEMFETWPTCDQLSVMWKYELPNVRLALFVELCRQPEFSRYVDPTYGLLDDEASESCLISYNRETESVKIHGVKDAANYIKHKIETFLSSASPQFPRSSQWQSRSAFKHPILADQRLDSYLSHSEDKISSNRVFALKGDNQDDNIAITLWKEQVLPSLPSILSEQLGTNYSASLVRLGSEEKDTSLHILIQTVSRRSNRQKNTIREKIFNQFRSNRIHISMTIMFKVVKDGVMKLIYEDCESDEGGEDNCGHRFYLSKRFWNRPGPGASLGLQCSDVLSATMGGWLSVGGELYFSTVLHIILESERQNQSNLGTSVVSPSLSDVRNTLDDLTASFSDAEDKIDKALPKSIESELFPCELLALANAPGEFGQRMTQLSHISSLLEEVNKPEQEFELGRIIYRSDEPGHRLEHRDGPNSQVAKRRMDWSLGRAKDKRKGSNHYRHPSDDPKVFFGLSDTKSLGQGPCINEICDVQPGARVYYVGQKSGRRSGTVHHVEQVYKFDGLQTLEWTMIADEYINPNMVAGDSGAWIIRQSDGAVMGSLWGCDQEGFLLFTPMKDLIEDIKQKTGHIEVSLPGSGSRRLGLISGKSKKHRKARRFGFFNKNGEEFNSISQPNLLPVPAIPEKIQPLVTTLLPVSKKNKQRFFSDSFPSGETTPGVESIFKVHAMSKQQAQNSTRILDKPKTTLHKRMTEPIFLTSPELSFLIRKASSFPITKKLGWDMSTEVHSPRITELGCP